MKLFLEAHEVSSLYYFFDPLFYSVLTRNRAFQIHRYITDINFEVCEYLFIPACDGRHWTMYLIVGLGARSEICEPGIYCFDSMGLFGEIEPVQRFVVVLIIFVKQIVFCILHDVCLAQKVCEEFTKVLAC